MGFGSRNEYSEMEVVLLLSLLSSGKHGSEAASNRKLTYSGLNK